MKYWYSPRFIIAFVLFLACTPLAKAQLDSCNAFLKGHYIEVGVNTNGAYGSSVNAPKGYHPKGGTPIGNACHPGYCPTSNLGFVADPDKDGWTVGNPAYYGDYFLPGTPQEGWSIEINKNQINAWNGPGFCGSTTGYPYSKAGLKGSNLSVDSLGPRVTSVWQGMMDSVRITQVTSLDTNTVYFTTFITLANTSTVTKKSVFYLRTVDPDNDEPEPNGGFTTDNLVEYQLPNAKNRTLVSADGLVNKIAYLGLGTLDCRARCFILKSGLEPTEGDLDSMYRGNGGQGDTTDYIYHTPNGAYTNDVGIGLVFSLGDIAAGDSVSFAYAYILRAADLDSAFLSTLPHWTDFGDSTTHTSGDTAAVCKNSIIPIDLVNGGYYNWTWYGTGLDTTAGVHVKATMGTTPRSIMAVGTSPSCATDTLIIILNPDLSPPPVTDTVHYCINATAVPLTATGQNLRYYYTAGSADTGQSVLVPRTDSLGTFTYYVSQTVRGCTSDRSTISVVIRPPLPALTVHSNGTLCLGDTLKMYTDSTNLPGYSFSWTGPDGFSSSDQNPVVAGIKLGDTTYTLIADSGNCPTYPSILHVPLHAIVAKVGADIYKVCLFDSLHVYSAGISDSATVFTWDFGTANVASGSGGGPYVVSWDTVGVKQIKLHIASAQCVADDSALFTVNTAPAVGFTIKKDVCISDTTALQVADYSLSNAQQIGLDGAGATVLNEAQQGRYALSWNTTGYKLVVVSITYPQCVRYASDSVDVHDLPPAQVQGISKDNVCAGDSVMFTAVAQGAGYSYKWAPGAYFIKSTEIGNSAIGRIPQSGYIYLTVSDSYGCTATDSIEVQTHPCCGVYVPSAFTPNGDGKNDILRPITIGHHDLKVFRIVNRWGQTVFESTHEQDGWDGKLSGVPQEVDTYFWYINYLCDGNTIEEKGEVTLIR